jgi:hypothetical protein
MSGKLYKYIKIACIIIATAAVVFLLYKIQFYRAHRFIVVLPMMPLILLPVVIVLYKWVNMDFDGFKEWFFNTRATNATLTCKKGHTSRVWVNYSGRGIHQNDVHGDWGLSYRIGGSPTITPETCPECGAQWSIPHKHHEHKLNLDEQYDNKY